MSKKAYIGIDGIARKINKMYIGVDGVARRIKKAYIGIGGVARPYWSLEPIEYWGTAELSTARSCLAATSIGNLALFGGGWDETLDIFDINGTLITTITNLSENGICEFEGATKIKTPTGDVAMFGNDFYIDMIDTSGTIKNTVELSSSSLYTVATSINNVAFFCVAKGADAYGVVDMFSESGTLIKTIELSRPVNSVMAATSIGNLALFGGGMDSNNSVSKVVEIMDAGGTIMKTTELTQGRECLAATSIGNLALFGGGCDFDDNYDIIDKNTIDIFSGSGTLIKSTELSKARSCLAATSVENLAIFGGGVEKNSPSKVVDVIDKNGTLVTTTELSQGRMFLAATSINSTIFFGGGEFSTYTDATNVVDIFKL